MANRRHFLATAERLLSEAQQHQRPLSLAVIDVDDFKVINDTRGHAAGDAALRHLVAVADEVLGGIGMIGRLGGDEFALLLPDLSLIDAVPYVERMAQSLDVTFQGQPLAVTMSSGVAALASDDDTIENLIARADVALYQAKASGRNRVVADVPQ